MILYILFLITIFIIPFVGYFIWSKIQEKELQREEEEIKKREETDVVFRYRKIPDHLLADEYMAAEHNKDTDYMEDMKKVMIGRSKKASFEEAYEYYYKMFDEWRTTTNWGCY